MIIDSVQLRQLALPLVEPLEAVHGVIDSRPTILVGVESEGRMGWGECVALAEPGYLDEWSDGEYEALRTHLVPRLTQGSDIAANQLTELFGDITGHRTSKAAIEMALVDSQLRDQGQSLAEVLGAAASSVECCVVLGFQPLNTLLDSIDLWSGEGYRTFKLKVAPGNDVARLEAVRAAHPNLSLRVDANGSYDWDNPDHRKALARLDQFGLSLIEQPLSPKQDRSLTALRSALETPITLDESVSSLSAALDCVGRGDVDVMTIKPGPIGGLAAAVAVHDAAVSLGIPLTLGGMIDGGLSRAANLAIAAMPGFAGNVAEVSPDGRWFSSSFLCDPVNAVDGRIAVPSVTGVGIGADVALDAVDRLTMRGLTVNRR